MTRSLEQIAESLADKRINLDRVNPAAWALTYGVETEQVVEIVRSERSRRLVGGAA